MSAISFLPAAWNCLQVQVERPISLAFAGAIHSKKPANTPARTADRIAAVSEVTAVLIGTPLKSFLERQFRGFHHIADFHDVVFDDAPEIVRRTATRRDREIF